MNLMLKEFITSNGKFVPPDVESYIKGGRKHDFCAFCNKKHHNYATYNFNKEDRKSHQVLSSHMRIPRYDDCFVCVRCTKEIEEEVYGDQIKHPVVLQIFKDSNMFLRKRITSYVEDLTFIDNSKSYPPPTSFTTGNLDDSKCIFCKDNLLSQEGRITPVDVPIGVNRKVYGRAYCCEYCDNVMSTLISEDAKRVNGSLHGDWDTCVECSSHYPITRNEAKAREEFNTTGNHYCSACIENKYDYALHQERFPTLDCTGGCGKQLTYDLTICLSVPKVKYCTSCLNETYNDEQTKKFNSPAYPSKQEKFTIKTFYSSKGLEEKITFILFKNGLDLPYTSPYYNYTMFHETHEGSIKLRESDDFHSAEEAIDDGVEAAFREYEYLMNPP